MDGNIFVLSYKDNKLLNKRYRFKNLTSMTSSFRFGIVDEEYRGGGYFIPDDLPSDATCLDVGANVGTFILNHSDRFKQVFFVEAVFENYQKCLENLMIYDVSNAVGFPLAVYSQTGSITKIYKHTNNDHGSGSLIDHKDWDKSVYHNVLTIAFPDLLKLCDLDHVHYMKVDIEGSEYEFLMDQDLSNVDYLAIELHEQLGKKRDDLIVHLDKYFTIIHSHIWAHYEVTYKNRRLG
jgi:FkbM family methyltransferase